MWQLVKAFVIFIILFVGVLILIKSLDYYTPDFSRGFLSNKKEIFNGIYKYGLYAHIASTPLVLLIGTLLIFFRLEKRFTVLHRNLGKTYVALVLFVAAPGGFIMAFHAFGGIVSVINFILLAALWITFTWNAFRFARNGNFTAHKRNMHRSYILTTSAVSLRLILFVFHSGFDWSGEIAYTTAAVLSWVPALAIGEYVNRTQKI